MKCFYHNDPDGWCSAYWVREIHECRGEPFEKSDFVEMNYDKEFPLDIVKPNEMVFIVDFSVDMDVFWSLRCKTKNIVWIDHHKTAIEKIDLTALDLHNCGIQVDGIAGCMLTWAYLHDYHDQLLRDPEGVINVAPLFTRFIHLWDTWQWKDHPSATKIEAFIVGLQELDLHPCSDIWDDLNDNEILAQDCNNTSEGEIFLGGIVNKGRNMIAFRDGYAKTCCDSIGEIIEFEGYKCYTCNIPKCNSEWFKSVDPDTYDILMPFYYNMNTKQFLVSLYSSTVDVSKIATKYGGGGHQNASGFQCETLLW